MEKNFLTPNTRPTTCLEILYCLLLLASPHFLWSQATVTCNSTNDRITIAISNAQAQQAGCPVAANYQVTSTTASNGSTVFYVSNESPVSGGVSTAFTDVYVEGPLVDAPFTIGASVFNDANQACTITISPLSGTSCFSADPPNLDDLPVVGIPCYVNGDRDLSTTEDEAFILVTYRPDEGANSLGGGADIFTLARDEQVGTTWGVAYNQTTSAYYTSATLKRHSDLGPGGTGAIYRVTGEIDTDGSLINNTVTTLIDLNADPNVNTGAAPTNRGLGTANDPSADANAYNMVGRIGIGDIDMLPDNNTLVAININTTGGNTPQLVFIDVSDESSAAVTKVVPINATTTGVGCSNGTLVPWGIGIDEATGEIYVGAVCNADGIGATRADLFGYVLKYNPTDDTFDEALEISLDFGRSNPAVGGDVRADWQTWRNDNTYAPRVLDAFFDVDPQPIIADIEFLDNGDMMVGLVDRFGFQTGSSQQKPDGTPTGALGGADAERGRPAGGLMRFFPNAAAPGTWTVPTDNQLFVYSDVASAPENAAVLGGIAYFNGQNLNELLAPTVDPSSANTNGLVLINLAPGRPAFPINRASDPGYQLDVQDLLLTPSGGTEPRTIEKGQGLGDLELGILNPTCILSDAGFNCTGSDAGGTTITLNPVRNEAGTSGTYSVSVPAGFSVANNDGTSGTMGNYGAVVTFTVTPALSTGQQIVVTITDTDVGNCEITANLSETDCGAPPCSITGSIVSQTCDEGDPNSETDDEYDFVVTATLTNGTSTLYDVLVDGSPLSPPVTVASGTNATFSLPATAGPSTVAISFRDADDPACISTPITSGDLMECSTPAVCAITAISTSPGTCDPATNTYDATVTVTFENDLGGILRVSIDGQDATVNNPVSPQEFTVSGLTSDGMMKDVTATFDDDPACTATVTDAYTAPADCTPVGCTTGLGGNVFIDNNNDGTDAGDGEIGQAGVLVEIYECDGVTPIATAITNAAGDWNTDAAITYPVRVEFSTPDRADLGSAVQGSGSGTNVQFVDAPSCDINYGVLDAAFCFGDTDGIADSDDSKVMVTCFINGATNGTGPGEVLVAYDYDESGSAAPDILATKADMGSVWSIAYDPIREVVYSGAFTKRHVGMGPAGPGAIYQYDFTTGSVSTLIDLAGFGLDVSGFPTEVTRNLGNAGGTNRDPLTFDLVGKTALGDIDISADGQTLFAVSLADKTVYEIDIENQTVTNTYLIPDPGCVRGEWRPFALSVHQGKVYVGGVCDASGNNGTSADLEATVYELTAGQFTEVLSIPLNYRKGRVHATAAPTVGNWLPWESAFSNLTVGFDAGTGNGTNRPVITHPQPVLSDLEFDVDGSIILGFFDRSGHQAGSLNLSPSGAPNRLWTVISGGDILRAESNGAGGYTLENNGSSGGVTTAGANNNEGPGGGEFYYGERFFDTANGLFVHQEVSLGGLAILPGSGEVLLSVYDPVNGGVALYGSAGVSKLSNANGNKFDAEGRILYTRNDTGSFGKGNGLGDIEIICPPAAIQIGNYAWIDTDEDGVQDACEDPLPNVPVTLYTKDDNGTLTEVATTTTDATTGEYYFDDVLPDTSYVITFGASADAAGKITVGGTTYMVTGAGAGEGANPESNDSDAVVFDTGTNGLLPAICYNTADTTTHDLDAGFKMVQPCSITATIGTSNCDDNGTPSDPSDDTFNLLVQGVLANTTSTTYNAYYTPNTGGAVETPFPGNPYPVGITASVTLAADGTTVYNVRVENADDPTCMDTDGPVTAPASCSDECLYDVELIRASVCSDGNYELRIVLAYANSTSNDIDIFVDGVLAGTHTLGDDNVRPGVDSFVVVNPAVLVCGQGLATYDITVGDPTAPACSAEGQFETAPIDPAGYIYCIENGKIILGGTLEVTDVAAGTSGTTDFGNVNFGDRGNPTPADGSIPNNGTRGTYNWEVLTPGSYTQAYTPPAGYTIVPARVEAGSLDPTGENDPYSIGSTASGDGMDSTFLLDFSETGNVYFESFDLDLGDPFIINNNVPLMSSAAIISVESGVSVCTYNATEGRSETTVSVVVDYTGVPEGEIMRVAAVGGTPLNGSLMERVINGQNGQQTFEFVMRSDGTQDVQFNVDFAPTDCSNTVGMTMIDLPENCCPTDETISVCNDGTTSATFTPPTGLTDLVWVVEGSNDTLENSDDGVTIDPATFEITVDATAPGFVTDTLRLIYRATDPANNACPIELCCPVLVAIKPCVSLGSTVFTDPNNDGMYDETAGSPETGVMGVTLVLVDPGPDMMVGGGDDVFIDTTMTDGNGDYLFSGLDTGNYYVLIPANENFDPGDPLAMFIQSSGPTDEMDNGEDGDDNGIQNGGAGMDVVSPVVNLQTGQEATDAGNGGRMETGSGSVQDNVDLVDADGDMTLDFGFLAEVIDVALTKTLVTSSLGANMVADLNELVEFQITVINQGTDSLNATSVVDYIPAGYTFNQANNPNFTGTTAGTGAAAGYELATYDFDFTADPLAPGASAPISIFLNVTGRVPDSSGYTNIAEVTSITDDNGMDRSNDDIDSTPDTDPTDDPGGVVGGDSDDETMGDGTGGGGTPGVDDENADEDDADPATVPLIDVALIKVIDPASLGANGTADNNEIIEFDITVVNQGTESVSQIAIIDSIPCGFAFTLAAGAGDIPGNVGVWTGNNFAATATIAGPLRPGASATLTLFLRVRPGLARCNNVNNGVLDLTNEAEVTSLVRDADGSTQQTDFDSNFDETDGDEDGGGIPNMNSDNVVLGDGTGTDGSDDPLTDDDDHDRATTEKIDVALIKFIDTLDVNTGTGPYSIGDLIKFDIRLYNQGNVPINDIDVIDYLPDGLSFDAAGNDGVGENTGGVAWTLGLDGNARTTFAGPIPTGDSAVVSIFLTVGSSTGNPAIDYLNRAEVYEIDAETTNQTTGLTMEVEGLTQDADSPLNENPDDDTGGVVNTPDDNNNQGGGPSEGEDQDNADPALVNVSQLSLGSTVFIDANNNGVQDAGEMGVPNVPLILLDSNGDPIDIGADGLLGTSDDNGGDVYTTDGDGNYFFGNLNPGDYSVQIPATAFDPGGPLADFPISSNETSSGFMEEDPDGTDAADPADDVDGDDNGRQPGGSGTVVDTDPITLSVGEEPTATETFQGGDQDDVGVDNNGNMTLDLSFFAPVSVGDTAFVDVNMDGRQDGGDLPLPNAQVTIVDVTTGLPVDTDAEGNPYDAVRMTGPDGSYLFDSLPPGNYQVIFDITDADNSEFYVYTTPNAGDDIDDSDVTPATPEGRTGTTDETGFLNSGESDRTLDAGVVCNISVTVADPFTVCSTQPIDLTDGASITPLSLGGTWDNNGGDGTFDGGTDFATATTYTPGPLDIANGSVTLTLTTNEPPPASGCEPASASVTVTILRVDCGQFMWDGGN